MNTLAPTLPCTPLEAPEVLREGATYLDYWHMQLEADPRLNGAVDLAASTYSRTQLLRHSDKIISPQIVERWDSRLGPFNHMREGAGDMLLGAAAILRANSKRMYVPRVYFYEHIDDTTDNFLDVTDSLEDMRGQQPNSALLLAGQLVCKAAWAYDDKDRREDLLGIGARMFRRVYDADKPWDDTKFKASQYLADYYFHNLSSTFREARRHHEDITPLREEAAQLLACQGNDILKHCNQAESESGEIFESFSSFVVRSEIYMDADIKGNHPEVRTAFKSEDNPAEPIERSVDSKFDLVLGRFTSNGAVIAAEAWQTKLGNYSAEQRDRPYHPAIKVIVGEGIGRGTMIDVVHGLKKTNAGDKRLSHVPQIKRARELFLPFITRQKKAA